MNLCRVVAICPAVLMALAPRAAPGAPTTPSSFTSVVQAMENVARVRTAPLDLEATRLEDEQREQEGAPFRFAIPRRVRITPQTAGTWEEVDDDTVLWRVRVTCPQAVSINLGFTRYRMPQGGFLFIYSTDHMEILGPFTKDDNAHHGQLWTPLIPSEDIVVELTLPTSEVAQLELELTSINHGYRGFNAPRANRGPGDSGACNVNVSCSQGDNWRDEIRSVAMYTVVGAYLCSGSLINNTAEDCSPYFLSAFHCFDGADGSDDGTINDPDGLASSIRVYWNYEISSCAGTCFSPTESQGGATFRAAYCGSDFLLVELDEQPSREDNVYYAGWDRSSSAPSNAVAIHHPAGDCKKISFENDPLHVDSWNDVCGFAPDTLLRVDDWDLGTTEGGSSGCPLFNQSGRVVGQLLGGTAACGNDGPDWFGWLYKSWNGGGTQQSRLLDWLDPAGTGGTYLGGRDCCGGDGDCDDGLFCNGQEICVGGGCLADSAPCPGQRCCESSDTCAECCNNSHCNDDNDCTGEVCDGGVCTHSDLSSGTPCGDLTDDDCTEADTCDGSGACLDNHKPDDTGCTDEGDDCTDDVCDGGVCTHPDLSSGTNCGDPTETECDKADTCDGAGTCQDNFEPDGTACDDPTDTDCDKADTCDGAGTCQDNYEPDGAACGDPTDTDCDKADTCDGADTCQANLEPDGTSCPDDEFCNGEETCSSGVCQPGTEQCTGPGLVCDEGNDQCDCLTAEACDDGLFCTGVETCNASSVCETTGDPCGGATPFCDEDDDTCVECLVDADCDDGLFCNGVETCDVHSVCQDGTPPNCDDGVNCTDDWCDAFTGCRHTPDDTECDDGVGCTVDTCDSISDCQFTPDSAQCNDGVACTDDVCDPVNDCQFAADDGSCNDGLFCTGTETCTGEGCESSGDPCTAQGLVCSEDSDSCDCDDDGDCDDGGYCNGVETCASGACQPGIAPCNGGRVCDEANKECDCVGDSHCEDNDFCNGVETCLGGECQSTGDPCVGQGLACDEINNECDCNDDSDCVDGVDCTIDACDENHGECLSTPDDTECDDGLFCNGDETCHPTDGCQDGTAPICDDGVDCTIDECDENRAKCVNTPDDTQCDDGLFCNGAETCNPRKGCQSRTPPACNDSNGRTIDKCDVVNDKCIHGELVVQGESSVTVGATERYTCTIVYNDGTVESVVNRPTWRVLSGSRPGVSSHAASISSEGVLTPWEDLYGGSSPADHELVEVNVEASVQEPVDLVDLKLVSIVPVDPVDPVDPVTGEIIPSDNPPSCGACGAFGMISSLLLLLGLVGLRSSPIRGRNRL